MARLASSVVALAVLVAALAVLPSSAIRFDLPAQASTSTEWLCITDFASKDALTIGSYKIGPGAGQRVNLHVTDRLGNRLHSRQNVPAEGSFAFTAPDHAEFDVCFQNLLEDGVYPNPAAKRPVELSIRTGYEAVDYQEMARSENLQPIELDMRKIQNLIEGVVSELDHVKSREEALRNTNESTYDRVKWFGIVSGLLLIGLGIYQVMQIRIFLVKKKAI